MQSTPDSKVNFKESMHSGLLAIAEIGGNRLLAFDEIALASCEALQGNCIAVEITDLDLQLYCHPGSWGIRLSPKPPPQSADATISGRLMALVALAATTDKISTSMQQRVSFHGDVALAQKLQKIIAGLDIDWEEAVARYTGDILAFQISKHGRRVGRWLRQSADSLLQTSSEYLREEARLSPTRIEFDSFQAQVTALKHDVARGEARLQHVLERSDQQ